MVPVLSRTKCPLAPCSEKRARRLMERGDAKAYWKQGIFCIILQRAPSGEESTEIVVAIDPGSKRTGVTACTTTRVILNLLQNTPSWVKKKVEKRRGLRNNRRGRKTPYRKCRSNRSIGGIPPSTKARWRAHLRTVNLLATILPVDAVIIEDIKARTLKGKRKWNKSFSPLQVGKNWFRSEVSKLFTFVSYSGWQTKSHRDIRGFKKSSSKLKDIWEAHNVDSHSLAEMYLGPITPFKGILRVDFLNQHRRRLHAELPTAGGKRRLYGSTMSLGLKRGTLVEHPKYGKSLVGGCSEGRLSLHDKESGKRLTQRVNREDLKVYTRQIWLSRFICRD